MNHFPKGLQLRITLGSAVYLLQTKVGMSRGHLDGDDEAQSRRGRIFAILVSFSGSCTGDLDRASGAWC